MNATIAIPTFNGDASLGEVLTACLSQQDVMAEMLVIDSGSTDRTLDIVAAHPGVRLHAIPNHEFGHGRTRNLAVQLADTDVVVFLTQDATPAHDRWLVELLAPFSTDERVAAVFGRQMPRATGCPTIRRDVREAFQSLDEDHMGHPPHWASHFFSDVNAAVRRDVLLDVPFRDVDYAEDRALALDLAAAGWRVAYAPEAAVWHSHDYSLVAYFQRMYDETRGVRVATGEDRRPRALSLLARAVRGTIKDWIFIWRDPAYPWSARLTWTVKVPLYNLARRSAIWLAARERPAGRRGTVFSLEGSRRAAPP